MKDNTSSLEELRLRAEILEKKNAELTQLHQLDMAELVRLRGMVEAVAREKETRNGRALYEV